MNNLSLFNFSKSVDNIWTERAEMGSTFYKILKFLLTFFVIAATLLVYVMIIKNFYLDGCYSNKIMILITGFAINFIGGLFVYHLIQGKNILLRCFTLNLLIVVFTFLDLLACD